jgi:hypothetical protein
LPSSHPPLSPPHFLVPPPSPWSNGPCFHAARVCPPPSASAHRPHSHMAKRQLGWLDAWRTPKSAPLRASSHLGVLLSPRASHLPRFDLTTPHRHHAPARMTKRLVARTRALASALVCAAGCFSFGVCHNRCTRTDAERALASVGRWGMREWPSHATHNRCKFVTFHFLSGYVPAVSAAVSEAKRPPGSRS